MRLLRHDLKNNFFDCKKNLQLLMKILKRPPQANSHSVTESQNKQIHNMELSMQNTLNRLDNYFYMVCAYLNTLETNRISPLQDYDAEREIGHSYFKQIELPRLTSKPIRT